eukprot:g5347.t1
MLFPLRHMVFSGIAWYQGENDVSVDGVTDYFKCAFTEIIKTSFRNLFGNTTPFIAVQLAPYNNAQHAPDALANVRVAQQKVLDTVKPPTGLVTTLDLGDSDSDCASGDIHPRSKEEVGDRLFRFLMYYVFKLASVVALPIAPVPYSCMLDGDNITILFDKDLSLDSPTIPTLCHPASMKPTRSGGRCVPSGYEVYYKNSWEIVSKNSTSMIQIDTRTIQLSVPGSSVWPQGTTLRYAWSDFPALSLYAPIKDGKVPISQFVLSCKR